MELVPVNESTLREAAEVHAVSWQESHRAICSPEFTAAHTPARQEAYLREKLSAGSEIWLLREGGRALGLVSVTGSTIADLYVLPGEQRKGFGSRLLRFAMGRCPDTPRLWILTTNTGAERLYRRFGFRPTGRRMQHPAGVDEIEMARSEDPAAFC